MLRMGHSHDGYGGFPGGDPRLFFPDSECSTDEEQAAHRAACASWVKALKDGRDPTDGAAPPDLCRLVARAAGVEPRCSFGLGTYSIPCRDESCDEAQEPDPPEPSIEGQVDDDRWDAAVREALAGEDEDLGDQADELGEVP